eukprot:g14989.t1
MGVNTLHTLPTETLPILDKISGPASNRTNSASLAQTNKPWDPHIKQQYQGEPWHLKNSLTRFMESDRNFHRGGSMTASQKPPVASSQYSRDPTTRFSSAFGFGTGLQSVGAGSGISGRAAVIDLCSFSQSADAAMKQPETRPVTSTMNDEAVLDAAGSPEKHKLASCSDDDVDALRSEAETATNTSGLLNTTLDGTGQHGTGTGKRIEDMTEEEQLAYALQASVADAGPEEPSALKPIPD